MYWLYIWSLFSSINQSLHVFISVVSQHVFMSERVGVPPPFFFWFKVFLPLPFIFAHNHGNQLA